MSKILISIYDQSILMCPSVLESPDLSGDVIQLLVLVDLIDLVSDSLLVILAAALDAGGGVGGDDDRSSNIGLPLEGGWWPFWWLISLHWTSNSGGRGPVENSASR